MIIKKTVREIIDEFTSQEFQFNLKQYLNVLMPIDLNDLLCDRIYWILNNVYAGQFANLGYNFNPVFIEDNNTENYNNINKTILAYACSRIALKLLEYAPILKLCDSELTKIDGLTPEKDYSKTYATEKSSGGAYSMSENAPINASLEEINTPNVKSQASSNTKREFEGADNEKEINPYYYEKYLQILNKYNIFHIISESVKSSIYEYNTLL